MAKQTNVSFKTPAADKVRSSNKFLWSSGAILVGLFIGWILLVSTGNNPIDYFTAVGEATFGSVEGFSNFIGTLSWMLPIGLAMVISFRAGVFNIGSAGQMMAGGLVGYFFAATVNMGRSGVIFSILLPILTGMTVAYTIGFLKTRYGIHEVISSILINWIIFYLFSLLTDSSIMQNYVDPTTGAMNPILESNSLQMGITPKGTTLNLGIFIVVPVVLGFVFLFSKTTWGIKQDVIGKNATAADYIGMKRNKTIMQSMVLSGAMAGLAGAIYYLGVQETLPLPGSDLPGEGFQGITLSLIAFNSPLGLFGSAAFSSIILNAETVLDPAVVNPYISDAILAIVIYGTAIVNFFVMYRPHDKFLNWLADGANNQEAVKAIVKKSEDRKEDLNKKTMVQLKSIAKERGLRGYSKLSKDELIKMLTEGGDE